mmetsp:Transcript_34713/g.87261  ORF Transcript_34713/g.87261 Transcript_34713/m.87261 type:complete len:95 (-) Transcript_34713:203-487(-)
MAAENDHEIEEEQAPAKGAAGEQARSLAALDGAADVSLDSTKASKALSGIAADGSANEVLRKQQFVFFTSLCLSCFACKLHTFVILIIFAFSQL